MTYVENFAASKHHQLPYMYGYGYNTGYTSYGPAAAHASYDDREAWPARSPPNYGVTAPYDQYQEYDRPPRGAATGPAHSTAGNGPCTSNRCCPRISPHQQTLRHHPQTWQDTRPDFYQNSVISSTSGVQMSNERSFISHEMFEDHLPHDPRQWSPHDVFLWLQWASRNYRIHNPFPERFQMNGKALCLMDASMFLYRVPEGGEMLYQDFQCRLQRAVSEDRPFNR